MAMVWGKVSLCSVARSHPIDFLLKSSYFYQFYHQLKKQKPSITVEDAQLALIKDFKIRLLIISPKRKIPPHFLPFIKDTFQIKGIEGNVYGLRLLGKQREITRNRNLKTLAQPRATIID